MKRSKAMQSMVDYFNVDARVNEWDDTSRENERIMVQTLLLNNHCYKGFNLYNAYAPRNLKTGIAEPMFLRLASIKEEPKVEGYEFIKLNTKPFIQYY